MRQGITLLLLSLSTATVFGQSLRNPKVIGDWILSSSKEPVDDSTKVQLTAPPSDDQIKFGFNCWTRKNTKSPITANIWHVGLVGHPTAGRIRITKEPGREASWILLNDRTLQTDVTKSEIEGFILAKGRAVVEVVTDREVAFKRVFEAPVKVNQAIITFLRVCNARSVAISDDLQEQLGLLGDLLGESALLLSSSPNTIQGRLQVVWDDYVKHLTSEHMPLEPLKFQLEAIQLELQDREPQDLTEEEASMVAQMTMRLYQAVVDAQLEHK